MNVNLSKENGRMTVSLEGEINTITAPELARKLGDLHGVSNLIFDLKQIRHGSSAGLRLFLGCLRNMKAAGGSMQFINLNEFVMKTFSSVGYDRIMELIPESRAVGSNE